MLYLTIALLYKSNAFLLMPKQHHSKAVRHHASPLLFPDTLHRSVTSLLITDAILSITLPLLLPSLLYQHTAPQHHDGASQLTTAPTL